MKFRNDKHQSINVRIPEESGYRWELIEPNQVKDIPEDVGRTYGLTVVDEEQKEPEEPSQEVEPEHFKTKLQAIDGIGPKTVDDIMEIYPTEQELLADIEDKDQIPVRNDVEKKLRKEYE